MDEALSSLHDRIWHGLRAAASQNDTAPAWQNMVLATSDLDGTPKSRMVILRDVEPNQRLITFHTDTRSPKWQQMTRQPTVALLCYDAARREQVRLTGRTTLHGSDDPLQQSDWDALSPWTRTTYCGGPPGHISKRPDAQGIKSAAPSKSETEPGRHFFGVVRVRVSSLDWYQHPRGDVRRATFEFSPVTGTVSAQWTTP